MKIVSGGIVFPWLGSLTVSGILIFSHNQAFAQVTPDNTLGDESSVVNTRDATSKSIDGGAVRGQNLFHSFEEFNVGEDRGVYFANPDAVNNIFSRVTGDNVSNILGTLGVDGAANLYLINPNGIVFGKGASLDVQGSFTATTADGIEFGEQGFFSASDPETPKLLTINPSAYLFNQAAPGAIANNSQSAADFNPATSFDDDFFGLRVPDGQSLLLLGGDLNFDGGGLVASGGRIELGAIAGEGIVGLNGNGSLTIPDNIARGDVSLTNGAGFLVAGDGGGDLAIAAKDIRIDSASAISAGIYSNLGSPDAQAGDIFINATDNLTVDNSRVANEVNLEAVGNAGDIFINANSFKVLNGSQIGSPTFGKGNGGNVTVRASNVELAGTSSDGELNSGLFATIESQAQGNGGNLTIKTDNLSLGDRAEISASTFGQGDSGNIAITADDSISLDASSYIINNVQDTNAVGNAGTIDIITGSLTATNGSQINSFTRGQGNAGDITIQATDEVIFDGVDRNDDYSGSTSSVQAGGVGDGGNLNIEASSLALTNGGYLSASVNEALDADSLPGGKGQGGNININVDDTLTIADGGYITSSTLGEGDSGNISINANNSIFLDASSYIVNNVQDANAVGNAGKIEITTGSLSATKGSQINSFTRGKGNAGDIAIQATNEVIFDGVDRNDDYSGSTSSVQAGGVGDGGNLNIEASSLALTNGGYLSASVREALDADSLPGGKGQGGNVNINVDDTLTIADGGYITSSTSGEGDSGNISITTDNAISLDTSSYISNDVEDINAVGDAGTIDITTASLTNNGLISSGTLGKGNAGTIDITTASLTNAGFINSSTFGKGNAGNITIKATDTVTFDGFDDNYSGVLSSVSSDAVGKGGNIDIQAGNLIIQNGGIILSSTLGKGDSGNISITIGSLSATNGGVISSSTLGQGNAGNISIRAADTVTFDGFDGNFNSSAFSSVEADAVGDGGDINITARSLSLTNGGQLEASTFSEGDSGNISITADDSISLDASSYVLSNVQDVNAVGDAGKIDITTGSLSATNGSQINSFTRGEGNAGKITIQATDAVTFDGFDSNGDYSGSTSSVEAAGVGNGGNINITARSLSLTNGGQLEASVREASDTDSLPGGKGQGGNINIDIDDTLTIADGNRPGIYASLGASAVGSGGNINIQASNLIIKDSGEINSSTFGKGDSGNISITAHDSISLDASSYILNNVQDVNAVGDAGKIDVTTGSLSATNGSQINSFTRGEGNAGDITIQATDTVTFDGFDNNNDSSGSFSSVEPGGVGNGGDINIMAGSLSLTNDAKLSASVYEEKISTNKEITGNAGNINLAISDILEANNGEISTSSNQSSGGEINITSGEINLRGDSNIRSNIFSGEGGGGNINITADSVIAFDDSDIFAFAQDGRGGNISLDTPAFFAENFTLNSLTADPETLDNNSRADVNATGAVSSGSVAIPDVSFIQNSLTELENNSINTDELVANSCVVPVGQRKQGKFIITGAESLPVRPGDGIPSKYPTGEVRNVPESNHSSWQPGDPIVEPQGAYRLANGKLVLSRQCSQ